MITFKASFGSRGALRNARLAKRYECRWISGSYVAVPRMRRGTATEKAPQRRVRAPRRASAVNNGHAKTAGGLGFSGRPSSTGSVAQSHLGENYRQTLFCSRAARVKGAKVAWIRGWWSGRAHSSVRGRRVRPPQVGVRQRPGASISEPRGQRSSMLVRSPRRSRQCHRCPASLPYASAGAELVIAPRSPRACSVIHGQSACRPGPGRPVGTQGGPARALDDVQRSAPEAV